MMQTHFQLALTALTEKAITASTQSDELSKTGFIHQLQPNSPQQTAQLLAWAKNQGLPVAFSVQAARQLAHPLWLDVRGLKDIHHDHASDFIVEVEAGVTFGELAEVLAKTGQAFPLSYPSNTTIGAILSTDRPALETGLKGYPRDYVLRTEVATTDGQLTTSGANVVKNVTGYDLHKLYVGSRNTFGVITQATLKVTAKPGLQRYLLTAPRDAKQAAGLAHKLQSGPVPPSVCELFQKDGWQLLVGFSGEADWLDAGVEHWLVHEDKLWKPLEENTAEAILRNLRQWPHNHACLEVALPVDYWPDFVETVSQWEEAIHWTIQARPLAGLVYLLWEGIGFCRWVSEYPIPALELFARLKKTATAKEGFVQWAQWPEISLPVPGTGELSPGKSSPCIHPVPPGSKQDISFWERAACFNLPDDPVIRQLLQTIKASYDPDGLLYTPEYALCAYTTGQPA